MGYGVPLPVLTWKHNEAVVQNVSRFFINEYPVTEGQSTAMFLVSLLKVCDSELEDAGNFSCTSSNALGNDVYTSVLTVIDVGGECVLPMYNSPSESVVMNGLYFDICVIERVVLPKLARILFLFGRPYKVRVQ